MTASPQPLPTSARPLILGIAGPSGSGKTRLARQLRSLLNATLLPLDAYYRDLSHLPPEERARQNFDHPDSIDASLLTEHLTRLAASQPVDRPCYDFATHTRLRDTTQSVEPAPVLIVEGILALHFPDLRSLYDLSIFVSAPDEVCLARRIHRDTHERGRTEASIREQYQATARPMAELYVLPSARHADLTVDGTGSLAASVQQILSRWNALAPRSAVSPPSPSTPPAAARTPPTEPPPPAASDPRAQP